MASKKHGIGHLTRSLKLIKNLKKKDYFFYLVGLNKKYKKYFKRSLFKKIIFSDGYNPCNKNSLDSILSIKPDICILDVPEPKLKFEKKLRDKKIKFFAYDNFTRKKIYSNFIINLNPKVSKKNYKTVKFESNCKLLLGINYFQFDKKKNLQKKYQKVRSVTLFFGGGQIHLDLLKKVLKSISKTKLKNKNIFFVSKQKLENKIKTKLKKTFGLRIYFFHNLDTLDGVLTKSDLAIVTAGTISFEASFNNVPMLLISLAKNQKTLAESWSELGAANYLGDYRSKNFPKKIDKAIKDILKENLRHKMYYSQKNIYKKYKNKLVELIEQF